MVKVPFGGKVFALALASIEAGSYDIALLTITVFIPFLPPGTIFGLLLAPGGKGTNCVELGTRKGASGAAMVFGLITNEIVCGSNGAFVGALQTTLLPALISICCGLYP
jgi:hypothetical protein